MNTILISTTLSLLPLWAPDGTTATETTYVPVAAGTQVTIQGSAVRIDVRSWKRMDVAIEATLERMLDKVTLERCSGELVIRVKPLGQGRMAFGHLTVHVPEGTPIAVLSLSGPVTVEGRVGETNVDTLSGDVRIRMENAPTVRVRTVAGHLDVEDRHERPSSAPQVATNGPVRVP